MITSVSDFRGRLPPFIDIETLPEGNPLNVGLPAYTSFFTAKGECQQGSLQHLVDELSANWVNSQFEDSTSQFPGFDASTRASSPPDGQRATAALLKEAIANILYAETVEYIKGATAVYIIHPPPLAHPVGHILRSLPLSPRPRQNPPRLISVRANRCTHVFPVISHQIDLPPYSDTEPAWLVVHLHNPDMPAMAVRVPESGPWDFDDISLAFTGTTEVEFFAMETIERYAQSKGLRVVHVHEPNGPSTFPDFEATIDGKEWTVEVTRVMEGIPNHRMIQVDGRAPHRMVKTAAQAPPISRSDEKFALTRALQDKASKPLQRPSHQNYLLVLVNACHLGIGPGFDAWAGQDLSAFDAVALVEPGLNPRLNFVKGTID